MIVFHSLQVFRAAMIGVTSPVANIALTIKRQRRHAAFSWQSVVITELFVVVGNSLLQHPLFRNCCIGTRRPSLVWICRLHHLRLFAGRSIQRLNYVHRCDHIGAVRTIVAGHQYHDLFKPRLPLTLLSSTTFYRGTHRMNKPKILRWIWIALAYSPTLH
jgi:hypothetical protein